MERKTLLTIAGIAVAGYLAYEYLYKGAKYPITKVHAAPDYGGNTVFVGNAGKDTFKGVSKVKAHKADGSVIAKGSVPDPKTDSSNTLRVKIDKADLEKASYLTKA